MPITLENPEKRIYCVTAPENYMTSGAAIIVLQQPTHMYRTWHWVKSTRTEATKIADAITRERPAPADEPDIMAFVLQKRKENKLDEYVGVLQNLAPPPPTTDLAPPPPPTDLAPPPPPTELAPPPTMTELAPPPPMTELAPPPPPTTTIPIGQPVEGTPLDLAPLAAVLPDASRPTVEASPAPKPNPTLPTSAEDEEALKSSAAGRALVKRLDKFEAKFADSAKDLKGAFDLSRAENKAGIASVNANVTDGRRENAANHGETMAGFASVNANLSAGFNRAAEQAAQYAQATAAQTKGIFDSLQTAALLNVQMGKALWEQGEANHKAVTTQLQAQESEAKALGEANLAATQEVGQKIDTLKEFIEAEMTYLKERVGSECAAVYEKLTTSIDAALERKDTEALPEVKQLLEKITDMIKEGKKIEELSPEEIEKEAEEAEKEEAKSAKALTAKPARAAPTVEARVTRGGKAAGKKPAPPPPPKKQPPKKSQPKPQQPTKPADEKAPSYRPLPVKEARDPQGKSIMDDLLGGKHEDWCKRTQILLGSLRAFVARYQRTGRINEVLAIIGQGLVANIMDPHSKVQLAASATVQEFAREYKSEIAPLALAADKNHVTVLGALLKTSAFKASGEVRKAAALAAETLLSKAPSVDAMKIVVDAGLHETDKMIVACAANLHIVLIHVLPAETLKEHLTLLSKSLGKLLITASRGNVVSDHAKDAVVDYLAVRGDECFVAARNIVDTIPNDNRVLRDALTEKLNELEEGLRAEPILAEPVGSTSGASSSTDALAGASAAAPSAKPTDLRTAQIHRVDETIVESRV